MRTGSDYLRSLKDGRQVFVDGERVKDVTAHVAFREAARSIARLYDIAAQPHMRERMTFVSPKSAPSWWGSGAVYSTNSKPSVPIGLSRSVSAISVSRGVSGV